MDILKYSWPENHDIHQELDEFSQELRKNIDSKERADTDEILPNNKYTNLIWKNFLQDYYSLYSTTKGDTENWSSRAKWRTSLEQIKWSTLLWAKMLASYFRKKKWFTEKFVITWGTEKWHTTKRHASWVKLDIRSKDAWWKLIIKTFGLVYWQKKTKTLTLKLKNWTIYKQQITLFYHATETSTRFWLWKKIWDDKHIDIEFWPLVSVG